MLRYSVKRKNVPGTFWGLMPLQSILPRSGKKGFPLHSLTPRSGSANSLHNFSGLLLRPYLVPWALKTPTECA
jgi:hypothetical protein